MQSILIAMVIMVSIVLANIKRSHTSLIALLGLFCMLFFASTNWVVLFFCYELSLVPMVLLMVVFGAQLERVQAVLWLLVYTMLFSVPMFLCLLLTAGVHGFDLGRFRLFEVPTLVG